MPHPNMIFEELWQNKMCISIAQNITQCVQNGGLHHQPKIERAFNTVFCRFFYLQAGLAALNKRIADLRITLSATQTQLQNRLNL